jgi:spermidine/putrescine ABC transporter ATP-binding subunit
VGSVELRNVTKRFGDVCAVDGVSLTVRPGEFLSLLGPSGCGKTTTLRLIAGFEQITCGEIRIAGKDVTAWPPHKRDIGMVFQHYALFPHLTVYENVAFGLRMRGVPRAEADGRVTRVLQLLHLSGLERRYQRQLSGGQQQRVALARALVIRPQILLLDEPLSNLDAKLREEMRVELKQVQQHVGITTVFVTHDQEEALILSDRIAVMNRGRIVQQGTPVEVYERPTHSFVAGFIGQANLLWGEVKGVQDGLLIVQAVGGLTLRARANGPLRPGERVLAVVKHSRVAIGPVGEVAGPNRFPARLEFVTYLGASVQYLCRAGEAQITATMPIDSTTVQLRPGAPVVVSWKPDDCLLVAE